MAIPPQPSPCRPFVLTIGRVQSPPQCACSVQSAMMLCCSQPFGFGMQGASLISPSPLPSP
eukprot:14863088-Alexandrium_andersonii.AAC.1